MAESSEFAHNTRPSARERRSAAAACILGCIVTLGIIPFAQLHLAELPGFIAALDAGVAVAMLVTASILRNQYRATGSAGFAFLAAAYAFGAVCALTYLITMPGVVLNIAPDVGIHTSPWIWFVWHCGFAGLALYYLTTQEHAIHTAGTPSPAYVNTFERIVFAILVTSLLLALRMPPHLPPYGTLLITLPVAARATWLLLHARRLQTSTNLWLVVTLILLALDTLATAVSGKRYTIGWYTGAVEGALGCIVFLVVIMRRVNAAFVTIATDHDRLVEQTLHDPLTGLYNRRGFDERIADALRYSRRLRHPISVIVLDVDFFKHFNDYYGHVAGDHALRFIASALSAAVIRPFDSSCRVGGEEFAIVLPATDGPGAVAVAERVRERIKRLAIKHAPGNGRTIVTVSLGIATANAPHTTDPSTLYARADAALYEAKRRGRDCIAVAPLEAINPVSTLAR